MPLWGGEEHDLQPASGLVDGFTAEAVIADKGYDSDEFVELVKELGACAVIAPRKNRKQERETDWDLYRERHLIECFINKLKQYRRVFSRFDKLSRNHLSFIHFVSSFIWLK